MTVRFIKSNENKKIIYIDATNLYDHSIYQLLLYDEIEMWHSHLDLYMNKIEQILSTPDDGDIGFFIEVDINYRDDIKEEPKMFPFCPENKNINKINLSNYMEKN